MTFTRDSQGLVNLIEPFTECLNLMAECARQSPPSKRLVSLYWSRLKDIEPSELRRAFAVFSERGKWANLDEILRECGHRPISSRQEQAESLARDQSLPKQDEPPLPPAWETNWGEFTFMAVGSQEIRDLERNLDQNGWTVIERRPDTVNVETRVGRAVRVAKEDIVQILAVRWKNPPPKKEINPYLRGQKACDIVARLKAKMTPRN